MNENIEAGNNRELIIRALVESYNKKSKNPLSFERLYTHKTPHHKVKKQPLRTAFSRSLVMKMLIYLKEILAFVNRITPNQFLLMK